MAPAGRGVAKVGGMSSPASRPVQPAGASQLNLRGAVDLSSLKQRPAPPAAGGGGAPAAGAAQGAAGNEAGAAPSLRVEVSEQNFQGLVELSTQVPVVFVLYSALTPGSAGLRDTVGNIVDSYNGRLVLGAADIDSFPQLAQAFQVQAVPAAVAVLKGQPVPLFQGSADESQIRNLLEELLKVAAANGVSGNVAGGAAEPEQPAPLPPLHQEAYDAIEAGDFAAAAAAYRKALREAPADTLAKEGLAQVELMARLQPLSAEDSEALRMRAANEPDSLEAQLAVADLDIAGGHVEDGFNRVVAFIGRNFGPEREAARVRLLELFDVVGTSDPRVMAARQALARVLF